MRYSPEHKTRTRDRILFEAARLFRKHGFSGVGIEAIMAAADLTRGGFYGHFRSKSELFAAVLDGDHDFTERLRARQTDSGQGLVDEAVEVVRGYLGPENRQRVGRGCSMASLAADVARAGGPAKRAYGGALDDLLEEFARGLPNATTRDPRAIASVALCIGGLSLARAVEDEDLSIKILEVCRGLAVEQLSDGGRLSG